MTAKPARFSIVPCPGRDTPARLRLARALPGDRLVSLVDRASAARSLSP